MRIIDGSGTHTFPAYKIGDFDNYQNVVREVTYKSIDKLDSQSTISTDIEVKLFFYQLTQTERDTLDQIYIDKDITSIDDFDEKLSGETVTTFTAVTNGFYITSPKRKMNFTKTVENREINYYDATMTIRFDLVATSIKP